jgi:hypothetical protein
MNGKIKFGTSEGGSAQVTVPPLTLLPFPVLLLEADGVFDEHAARRTAAIPTPSAIVTAVLNRRTSYLPFRQLGSGASAEDDGNVNVLASSSR